LTIELHKKETAIILFKKKIMQKLFAIKKVHESILLFPVSHAYGFKKSS